MESREIRLLIDGQEYALSTGMLRPVSPDTQGEVLTRITGIERVQTIMLSRLDDMSHELEVIRHDQMTLQTSVYCVLAAIGIFLACLALPSIIASTVNAFRPKQTDTPKRKDGATCPQNVPASSPPQLRTYNPLPTNLRYNIYTAFIYEL